MQYMIWKSKYLAEFLHSNELAEIAINLMLNNISYMRDALSDAQLRMSNVIYVLIYKALNEMKA